VLDADIVPRLSIESFEDLRNSVLEMICRIKVSKYEALRPLKRQKDKALLAEANAHALCEKNDIKETKFKQQVDAFYEFQASLKEKDKRRYIGMCPPGRIIQLLHLGGNQSLQDSERSSRGSKQYAARWAERYDFQRVIVSSHLLFDHDPINLKNKLQDLASTFGLRPPYSNCLREDACSPADGAELCLVESKSERFAKDNDCVEVVVAMD
jgi:hypothetical protein